MLRIIPSTNAAAAKQYYTKGLERGDYYIDGQELPGVWGGKAAERLGLSGEVNQADYFALCDNRSPDGEQLTPRQKDNRRVGYDFTFSAPKSASVTYELSGDERILKAFRESVRETMAEIESEMKTRVRGNGANEDRVTGNMVWADFTHFTSRPVDGKPDPHLHSHVFAFNTTWDETEGRWKAGQFGDLKRDASYYEAAFDARLSEKLNELGYHTAKNPKYSFEVASVPKSVIDKFSRRRNAIEAKAAEKGIESPEGKHEIGRRGREGKAPELGKTELRAEWASRLTGDERAAMAAMGTPSPKITADAAVQYAIDHSFERVSTISEKRLKAEALRYGVGASVLPDEVDRAMAKRSDIIHKEVNGEAIVTTQSVLEQEQKMLAFARAGRGRFGQLGNVEHLPHGLSAEQGAAAAKTLQSRDRVVGIRGAAGVGKTHVMKATVGAIEAGGTKVHVFAPSAQASRGVLRDEAGFKDADTLERLLVDSEMQRQVKGQVIWVDEAGMVGNRDMGRLFEVARKQDARIVLSGDYRQHGSVKAGDAFRILESEAGVKYAQLQQIRRQQDREYQAAVRAISKGTAEGAREGFEMLDKKGWIVEAKGDERHALLVEDYLQAHRDGKSALIVAPTRAEAAALTSRLRDRLVHSGTLERGLSTRNRNFVVRNATNWTDAEKGDHRNYSPGLVVGFNQNARGFRRGESAVVVGTTDAGVSVLRQNGELGTLPKEASRFQVYQTATIPIAKGERIRITQNGKTAGEKRVNNGDIFTVDGFTKDGDLKLSNGQTLPKTYGHFAHGYVDTSYGSQGKTTDRVFIAAGNESLKATNQQQWYVSCSRAKEMAKVYVSSKDDVREAIARSNQRMSAVELVKKPPARVKERLERSRLVEYGKERIEPVREPQQERKHG